MAFAIYALGMLLGMSGCQQVRLANSLTPSAAATKPAQRDRTIADAARRGDLEAVRRFVISGAEINPANPEDSPLVLAAAYRRRDVAEYLVLHGAHVNTCGRFGTALHWAAYLGDIELAKFLLDHDADVNIVSRAAETALHRAAADCDPQIVELLIQRGAKVNATSGDASTPLMWAILPVAYDLRARQVVRVLLDHGARVDVVDKNGRSPLLLAREAGDDEILQLLRSHAR